jgi:hypothetical protein
MGLMNARKLKEPRYWGFLPKSQLTVTPDIRRPLLNTAVGRAVPKVVQLSNSDNESDIQTYTRTWAEKIASNFAPFTDDMKDYLVNLTVANAQGTSDFCSLLYRTVLTA